MKQQALVVLLATLTSVTILACGDTVEPGTTTGSSSSSSSSASSSASSSSSSSSGEVGGAGGAGGMGTGGMGGMGTGGMGGAGGSGPPLLNGCSQMTAEDFTAMAAVTIDTVGFAYSPKCIRVKAGTDVTFNSNFMFHPLEGGTVTNGIGVADSNSPITPTTTGMMATFKLANAGDVPYYCAVHASGGMMGAIFVEP